MAGRSWSAAGGPAVDEVESAPRRRPAVAAREARARHLPLRQELLRLVIHGTLHVLGYDHPRERRTASAMWRRQERYLKELR